jgi:hypothetical protein
VRASILPLLVALCSMPACGSDDDDSGTGGAAGTAGTAGSGGAGGTAGVSGSSGAAGGLQVCLCCGAEVIWPADKDCSLGACDGYCNFVDASGGSSSGDAASD